MEVAVLRDRFKTLMNNDLMTEADIDQFMDQGITRVSRVLRLPIQKFSYSLLATLPNEPVLIPPNYIQIMSVKVNGRPVRKVTIDGSTPYTDVSAEPEVFFMDGSAFMFGPGLRVGDQVDIRYYGTLQREESVLEMTPYSLSIPDIVLYSSAIFAGIFYSDERLPVFTQMFTTLVQEAQDQADLDELAGASIRNPYEGVA